MSVESMRGKWEMEKWVWKWITISAASIGFIVTFLTIYLESFGLFEIVIALLSGAAFMQILYMSVEAMFHRMRASGVGVGKNALLAAIAIGVLLIIIAQGFFTIPGLFGPLLIGASAVAFGNSLRKSRDAKKTRVFVEVENDGNILELQQGDLLLNALEDAGYNLLTHCGGAGDCASCRVNLQEHNQAIGEENFGPVLTPRQQNEGWVISCKTPVMGDMKVSLFKPLVINWPSFDRQEMTDEARELREALPGFDCEACGYFSCNEYAVAVSTGEANSDRCLPGGEAVNERLKFIMTQPVKSVNTEESDG